MWIIPPHTTIFPPWSLRLVFRSINWISCSSLLIWDRDCFPQLLPLVLKMLLWKKRERNLILPTEQRICLQYQARQPVKSDCEITRKSTSDWQCYFKSPFTYTCFDVRFSVVYIHSWIVKYIAKSGGETDFQHIDNIQLEMYMNMQ